MVAHKLKLSNVVSASVVRSEFRIPKDGDTINFPAVQNDGEIPYL